MICTRSCFFFFFQAEDGIRDLIVTGVQTCALPIYPGGHVAIKCPTHLWHLDALAATYPQGRLVRLHREPVAAVASACSLTAVVRSARSGEVDRAEIGRYWTEPAEAALGTARRSEPVHGL